MVINLSSDIIRYLEKHGLLLTAGHCVEAKRELIAERMSRNYEKDTRAT